MNCGQRMPLQVCPTLSGARGPGHPRTFQGFCGAAPGQRFRCPTPFCSHPPFMCASGPPWGTPSKRRQQNVVQVAVQGWERHQRLSCSPQRSCPPSSAIPGVGRQGIAIFFTYKTIFIQCFCILLDPRQCYFGCAARDRGRGGPF